MNEPTVIAIGFVILAGLGFAIFLWRLSSKLARRRWKD
jgi:hypothetical protein